MDRFLTPGSTNFKLITIRTKQQCCTSHCVLNTRANSTHHFILPAHNCETDGNQGRGLRAIRQHQRDRRKKKQQVHSFVNELLSQNHKKARKQISKSCLPKFLKIYFVLVTCNNFSARKKPLLLWHGWWRIVEVLSDNFYQVEELRKGTVDEVHRRKLYFYHDAPLNFKITVAGVITSE